MDRWVFISLYLLFTYLIVRQIIICLIMQNGKLWQIIDFERDWKLRHIMIHHFVYCLFYISIIDIPFLPFSISARHC